MVIYSDGTVEQLPPGIFTSSCLINIRWFPFDVQSCPLKFGSWTYDGTKIDLKVMGDLKSGSTDGYRKSGEWDLISEYMSTPAHLSHLFYYVTLNFLSSNPFPFWGVATHALHSMVYFLSCILSPRINKIFLC